MSAYETPLGPVKIRKRRPRDIGTAGETAVVRLMVRSGFPYAERRSLKGTLDQGDVTGVPGVCVEVKSGDAARYASDGQITKWLHETETERVNARADIGVLVVQRWRVPVERWWAVLPCLDVNPHLPWPAIRQFPVRMYLKDALWLLRHKGYGTDPETDIEENAE